MRGQYPITAAALEAMMRKRALTRRFAAAVARKAGLKKGLGGWEARTLIDGYVSPLEDYRARQWLTDLTDVREIFFACRASETIYLHRFPTDSEILMPDFIPFYDDAATRVAASSGSSTGWLPLYEGHRVFTRITLSTHDETVGLDPNALSGPFAISLMGRP